MNGRIAVLFSDHVNLTVAVPVNTAVIMLATQLEHTILIGEVDHFSRLQETHPLLTGQVTQGGTVKAVQSLVDQVMIACNTVNRQGEFFQKPL